MQKLTNALNDFMVFKSNFVVLRGMSIQQTTNIGADTHVTNNTSKKILIIDDNESMTKLLTRLFETRKLDCTVSDDGISGLQQIYKQNFDAILLDLAMPDFSGWDVIKSLEKKGKIKEERIFVFTASAISPLEMEELLKRGIQGCIKKPVKLEHLLKVLGV